MKRLRWLPAVLLATMLVAGCNDSDRSSTDKTPPPAVQVGPSPTTAAILPAVQSGGTDGALTSPVATPTGATSPLPTPAPQ